MPPQATTVSQRISTRLGYLVPCVFKTSNGDEVVLHPENGHLVELPVSSFAPRVGDGGITVSGVQRKAFLIATGRGLLIALPISFSLHVLGAATLNAAFGGGTMRFTLADIGRQILAALAGALVPVLTVCAICSFALRQPSGRRRDECATGRFDGMFPVYIGVLSSPCAMPLGFVMLPRLATEVFEAWHVLVVAATGLGVLGELFLVVVCLVALVLL